MVEQIYNAIKAENSFDGVYYEKFLSNPITITLDRYIEDIVRVLIVEDKVMVHLLNDYDETLFVHFSSLDDKTQNKIYADVCRNVRLIDIDEFFEKMKSFLDNGDKLIVKYDVTEDGEDDYDNLVYSIYNSCDDIVGEYRTATNIYKSF